MKSLYLACMSGYLVLIAAAFFIGCLFFRKSYPLEYRLLAILSGLTLFVESGLTLSLFLHGARPWVYNFFTPVESAFILYILYRATQNPLLIRLHTILLILLSVSTGILWMRTPSLFKVNTLIVQVGLFANLISSCLFLIDSLLNKSETPMTRQPFFWMAAGLLIFCSTFLMIPPLLMYFTKIPFIFFLSTMISNAFMYSGFIACFICFRRNNRFFKPVEQFSGPSAVLQYTKSKRNDSIR